MSVSSAPGTYRCFTNVCGHLDTLRLLQREGQRCSGTPSLSHGEAGSLRGERDLLPSFLLFLSRLGPCHRSWVQPEGRCTFQRIHGSDIWKDDPLSLRWTSGQAHTETPHHSPFSSPHRNEPEGLHANGLPRNGPAGLRPRGPEDTRLITADLKIPLVGRGPLANG